MVLHRRIKIKKHEVKVLHRKMKYKKHKIRVFIKPNIQKLIIDNKSRTKAWGIAFKLYPQKMPHPPFHVEKEGGAKVGLRSIINKGITTKELTKRKTPLILST